MAHFRYQWWGGASCCFFVCRWLSYILQVKSQSPLLPVFMDMLGNVLFVFVDNVRFCLKSARWCVIGVSSFEQWLVVKFLPLFDQLV